MIRTTIQTILTDEMLEHIADKVMEYQARDTDSAILIEQYKNQLKETETAIAGILRAVEAGMFSPSMKDRMDELEGQKAELNADIEREQINQQRVSRDEVLFFLSQFKGGDPDDPDYKQRLVDTFVNSVWLYDDKLVLTYNYSGDDNKITLNMVNAGLSGKPNGCSDNTCQAPPSQYNPNSIFKIGDGFGFIVLIEDIEI